MSPPPPPNERAHQPHYSSAARRNMYGSSQSSRTAEYSSLGDALGGMRQPPPPQYPTNIEYQSPSVSGASAHPHVGPDGRTQYATTTTTTTTPTSTSNMYDYSYPPSSYEQQIPQYGPSSLPPMRTSTASPAAYPASNQPIAPYNVHGTPYTSTYPQAPYVLADEEWGSQSFAQDAVPPAMFTANRSDVVASSPQIDTRTYGQPQFSASPVNVYSEDRTNPPPPKGKSREYNTGHGHRSPSSTADSFLLDYPQLLNTYEQLQRECAVINRGLPGIPDSLDTIDNLMRAAKLGLHLLQPASSPIITAQHRGPSEESRHSAETENISPELPTAKRQTESTSSAPAAPDGQKCLGCGATATPEWRRGPLGPRTLCNACGLVYAKMIKKRGHDISPNSITGINQPQHHHAGPSQTMADEAPSVDSPNDGHSDDELSYGSQGQH